MKAMKRLVAVAVVFAGLGAGTAFANYPVIDVANLTESIEQVYQTYMDIQQAIQSVQNQYIMIKHSIEAVKNFNFDQFKALASPDAWENPETIRNAYKATLEAANSFANRVKNVENKLNGKHIRFGNMKLSATDILGISPDGSNNSNRDNAMDGAIGSLKERMKKIGKAWSGQLTWEERCAIMEKYGMSAENYAETQAAENIIEGAAGRLAHIIKNAANDTEDAKEERDKEIESEAASFEEGIKKIQESASESTTARQDLQNTILIRSLRGIGNMKASLDDLGANIERRSNEAKAAAQAAKEKDVKQARDDRKAMREANYGSNNFDW